MLRIRRTVDGDVVYTLSGRIGKDHIAELESLVRSEEKEQQIVLDLRDVTLADHDAITFLGSCEASGITVRNCPAYIREWIARQRSGS